MTLWRRAGVHGPGRAPRRSIPLVAMVVVAMTGAGSLGVASPVPAAPGDTGEESQAYVEGTLATVSMSQSVS